MEKERSSFKGRIRPAWRDDLEVLVSMIGDIGDQHGPPASVTREDLGRDILGPWPWVRILLAEADGAVVGYVALSPLAQIGIGLRGLDVQHLYVVPQARRTGVGTALIEASQALARAEGCHYLEVGAEPDDEVARDICAAMGFDQRVQPVARLRMDFGRGA